MEILSDRVTIYGNHDAATHQQIANVMESGASYFVECADGHLGYGHPIGGVAAYRDHVSLSGVGFDIGCGNTAVRTDLKWDGLSRSIESVMDEVVRRISFGVGRVNSTRVDHELFDDPAWKIPAVSGLKELARDQLGTVGSGNHYVDIFVEESTDDVWIGVHFGSRGLGHKTATHFLKAVGARDDMMAMPALIPAGTPMSDDYLECMGLTGRYARAGRDWVIGEMMRILGGGPDFYVNNHHNFSWIESHHGETFHVARKGATPAFPGQLGFIGGSMGDDAVIVRGVDSPESRKSLYSTVHGAGRVMSRTAARGKPGKPERIAGDGKTIIPARACVPGAVSKADMDEWIVRRGVCLRGADLDEAPQAYRRLDDVLRFHEGTIEILHRLRPVGVAMAGIDVRDPYKD